MWKSLKNCDLKQICKSTFQNKLRQKNEELSKIFLKQFFLKQFFLKKANTTEGKKNEKAYGKILKLKTRRTEKYFREVGQFPKCFRAILEVKKVWKRAFRIDGVYSSSSQLFYKRTRRRFKKTLNFRKVNMLENQKSNSEETWKTTIGKKE